MSAPRGRATRSSRPGASTGRRFAIINFANADMVGHTGVIDAAVQAIETVDECLGEVVAAVHGSGGACVVTADHGNADHMLEPDGSPNTAHSLNPVPLIVTVPGASRCAPTAASSPTWRRRCSSCWASSSPRQMTGRSLLLDERGRARERRRASCSARSSSPSGVNHFVDRRAPTARSCRRGSQHDAKRVVERQRRRRDRAAASAC